jgi:hypothetical protein
LIAVRLQMSPAMASLTPVPSPDFGLMLQQKLHSCPALVQHLRYRTALQWVERQICQIIQNQELSVWVESPVSIRVYTDDIMTLLFCAFDVMIPCPIDCHQSARLSSSAWQRVNGRITPFSQAALCSVVSHVHRCLLQMKGLPSQWLVAPTVHSNHRVLQSSTATGRERSLFQGTLVPFDMTPQDLTHSRNFTLDLVQREEGNSKTLVLVPAGLLYFPWLHGLRQQSVEWKDTHPVVMHVVAVGIKETFFIPAGGSKSIQHETGSVSNRDADTHQIWIVTYEAFELIKSQDLALQSLLVNRWRRVVFYLPPKSRYVTLRFLSENLFRQYSWVFTLNGVETLVTRDWPTHTILQSLLLAYPSIDMNRWIHFCYQQLVFWRNVSSYNRKHQPPGAGFPATNPITLMEQLPRTTLVPCWLVRDQSVPSLTIGTPLFWKLWGCDFITSCSMAVSRWIATWPSGVKATFERVCKHEGPTTGDLGYTTLCFYKLLVKPAGMALYVQPAHAATYKTLTKKQKLSCRQFFVRTKHQFHFFFNQKWLDEKTCT